MQTHRESSIARLRSLTHLLDNAINIPGTRVRFGIDPIVGMLPGGGDLVMSLFSIYIVIEAARMGLPKASLVRMIWNLIVDVVIGIVPIAGDLFDFAWKANTKNVALIEAHFLSSDRQAKTDFLFVAILILGFLAVVVGMGALVIYLVGAIWKAIFR
ncbi:MAG TPA: DUF4112 domain-containing protein [Leptolyngbya sp.]|jgi:hypothetical protein|nr:DUF4112 domain-containing protein [Leptolyngbya sp.]